MANNSNLYDDDSVLEYVKSIERLNEELASKKASYMAEAKVISDEKKRHAKIAKKAGVPMEEANALLKHRALQRKLQDIGDGFEDATIYDAMVEAFGDSADLPLFASALDKAKPAEKKAKAKRGEELDAFH